MSENLGKNPFFGNFVPLTPCYFEQKKIRHEIKLWWMGFANTYAIYKHNMRLINANIGVKI